MAHSSGSGGPLHGAGKWITAFITTGAALAALLVNAKNLGVSEWLGLADYAARRIWLTPRADTLDAVGDTAELAATVTDKSGATLRGVSLRWQSSDTSVAAVDSSGVAVARGPGTTRISATVRDLVAQATLLVRQRPTAIEIPGDTVVRVLEGDTVPFVAHALDARQHRIRALVPRWRSADSAVVAVDSLGRAAARAPGWTTLTAALADLEARIAVRVDLAPAAIALVTGGDQRVPAGRALPQLVVTRVLSRGGTPVPGVEVTFAPGDAEARADPEKVITGRDGVARSAWILSPRPGRQTLVVSAAMLDSTLTLRAEADPLPRNTKVEPVGMLAGRVGDALPEPVVVRVTDTTGVALVDVPVTWAALDRGIVAPLGDRTDSLGEARARWTLGPRAGQQRLRVQAGNPRTIPPVTIIAAAGAASPAVIAVVSGQGQAAPVGAALPKGVVLAVRDEHGNGVAAVTLTLRPAQGGVTDTTPVTDSSGRVTVRWTLGRTTGTHVLEARATGLDSVAKVTARARPGAPANVAFPDAAARGTAGTALRLAAVVTDAYGNPVPDALVLFAARTGTLSASRVMSDTAGRAATRWTPAAAAGDQQITATVRGTTVKATHTVRVSAPTQRR